MDQSEKETRRLLKTHAMLVRHNGGHEVWSLPDGGRFTVKVRGRRAKKGTWRNALTDLRRRLRGDATHSTGWR